MAWNGTLSIVLAFWLVWFSTTCCGTKIPAVIVFGDSTVDTGNNNHIATILKSNFRPYGRDFPGGIPTGRFCNGRLPLDFLSEAVGLKPTVPAYLDPAYGIADFATGVCFASAGTGYDKATSDVTHVIPLWNELDMYKDYQSKLRAYLGPAKANYILTNAVYALSIGTNDFLENYFLTLGRRSQFTVDQYSDYLVSISEKFIRELYGLGLRKLALIGTPPMGCLPLERTLNLVGHKQCNEYYNTVSLGFNARLARMVDRLNKELPGIKVVNVDIYSKFLDIIQNPAKYGFLEAERGCCGTGRVEIGYTCNAFSPYTCPDANKFVFWDAFHPTEKTNRILSDYIFAKYLHVFL